jgi:iron complex outermembrane receptor protein
MPEVRITANAIETQSFEPKESEVMIRQATIVVAVLAVSLTVGRPRHAGAAEPSAAPSAELSSSSVTSTNQMPVVVVTATRLPGEKVSLDSFPANVSVLSTNDLAASPTISLPDTLSQQVGLVPLDTVGFGQFGNLSLRGYGERTGALILVDGMRVNDAGDSTSPFLWNSVPLDNIEQVEIIRGGASTTYGEGAIGGVINIITRKPSDQPLSLTATGSGGNLGYYSGQLGLSGTRDQFDYVINGGRQEWNGWRDNSGYEGWTVMAKPGIETELGRFTLSYNFHDETVENPGVLTQAQYDADPRQAGFNTFVFENQIHRASLDYERNFDGGWSVLGKVYGQDYVTDSESAFGVGRIEQPNYGTTWQATHCTDVFGRSNMLTLGIEAVQQDFESLFDTGLFGVYTTVADNWTTSFFLQDTYKITQKFGLVAGIRFDYREWDIAVLSNPPSPFSPDIRDTRHADAWSPKVGLTYEIVEKTTSWVTLSRSFRLPSGFDIGTAGSTPGELFFANPDVQPVEANTIEVGARTDCWRYLGGSLAYFHSDVNDDILFNPFTFQNENFDSIRQGVELSLISRPWDWMDIYYTTAFIDAQFDDGAFDGNRLPLVAEWQLTGGVNVRPCRGLQLTLETLHVRGQTANNDLNNNFSRNDYTVLNAKARYAWRNVTLFASVNNLLDRLYQSFPTVSTDFLGNQQVAYNPAPGINFQAGATIAF